jgi:molybdopterin synthase sulfur carrier subunit
MQVNFYANLRQIVGAKTVDVPLAAGATVSQLLQAIVARYPALRPILLDETGALYRHVHLFVNGRDAPYLADALNTPLAPGDTVDVFPAVAGGCIQHSNRPRGPRHGCL